MAFANRVGRPKFKSPFALMEEQQQHIETDSPTPVHVQPSQDITKNLIEKIYNEQPKYEIDQAFFQSPSQSPQPNHHNENQLESHQKFQHSTDKYSRNQKYDKNNNYTSRYNKNNNKYDNYHQNYQNTNNYKKVPYKKNYNSNQQNHQNSNNYTKNYSKSKNYINKDENKKQNENRENYQKNVQNQDGKQKKKVDKKQNKRRDKDGNKNKKWDKELKEIKPPSFKDYFGFLSEPSQPHKSEKKQRKKIKKITTQQDLEDGEIESSEYESYISEIKSVENDYCREVSGEEQEKIQEEQAPLIFQSHKQNINQSGQFDSEYQEYRLKNSKQFDQYYNEEFQHSQVQKILNEKFINQDKNENQNSIKDILSKFTNIQPAKKSPRRYSDESDYGPEEDSPQKILKKNNNQQYNNDQFYSQQQYHSQLSQQVENSCQNKYEYYPQPIMQQQPQFSQSPSLVMSNSNDEKENNPQNNSDSPPSPQYPSYTQNSSQNILHTLIKSPDAKKLNPQFLDTIQNELKQIQQSSQQKAQKLDPRLIRLNKLNSKEDEQDHFNSKLNQSLQRNLDFQQNDYSNMIDNSLLKSLLNQKGSLLTQLVTEKGIQN